MRRLAVPFLIALCLLGACGKKSESLPFQVGDQKVSLAPPAEWEHVNYGDQHQWRRDFERISLIDLGNKGSYLDLAQDRALEQLGENERREIAVTDTLTIDGRAARLVDTWDKVSHQYRKRYLLVLNGRTLLVMYTMQGKFDNMAAAFDRMTASLTFADSVGHQP
jgi:hypothetical protein